MIIFMNSLKRILKNKAQLVIMLILPLVPVLPSVLEPPASDRMLIVGVADEDRTELTATYTDVLRSTFKTVEVEKDRIENELLK